MAAETVTIRTAGPDDACLMADVDRQSWPSALAVTAEQYLARIETYASGQLVAVIAGRIVGVSSAQRVTTPQLKRHGGRYDAITDEGSIRRTHREQGEIYQLINVGVVPSVRGRRLGRQLVDAQIALARNLNTVRRIVGYTRPARFHQFPSMAIEEYLDCPHDAPEFDTVVAFHLLAGAQIVSLHEDFRPADVEACGYGILIEYPVGYRHAKC